MGYFRKIKTTQERRRWVADEELMGEYPELRLRAGRSFRTLPNSWDDIHKSAWEDRSWKRHRDRQWSVERSENKRKKGSRGTFDTPMVEMHKSPFWLWGFYTFACRVGPRKFPYRVRFKYIKNKTA